jgi:hypothetical protein
MPLHRLVALLAYPLLAAPSPAAERAPAPGEPAVAFFEKKVRPLLAGACYNCHSADTNAQGGLRVDDRNGLLRGGGRGPAVVPGQPEKSLLLRAVRRADARLKMPPEKALLPEQVAILTRWIKDGAAWPAVRAPVGSGKTTAKYQKLRKQHWAWQPLRALSPPAVRDASWPRGDIDRFILARLEQKGLAPVRDADKRSLLRRVAFDLTGLPPTLEEVGSFLEDQSPGAFRKVVERLLASPGYPERWGRHWLDVARYGESTGSSRNLPYPHAWRYRDYVISSFNNDKPYDRFLTEQIAGDLLPAGSQREQDECLVATGFLALGVKDVNQRFTVRFVMDNIDEQIDTLGRAVLALSLGCARCHDHKFDPIPMTDYYALAGIFRSTDLCAGVRNKMGGGGLDYYDTSMLLHLGGRGAPDPLAAKKLQAAKKELALARAQLAALNGKAGDAPGGKGRPKREVARQKVARLQDALFRLTDPASAGPVALGLREGRTVRDTEIRIRGEAEAIGPVVPRGFLTLLNIPQTPGINPRQSGRLELARWLTSAKNPLTPRVMVNRVWGWLFGQGLVGSVDNFGATGEAPSHPELLDHLAARFVRDGWSVKKLIRAVVLSRAYQLGSEAQPSHLSLDPGNRLVWRHGPRRLEAEEIRDAMLAASGGLNRNRPGGSPAGTLRVKEISNNGPEAKRLTDASLASTHRSVYLPLVRTLVPRALEVFDFAEQGMVTGRRDTTTVATQALYLLNDPFVLRTAQAFGNRLHSRKGLDDGRIDLAYRLALARPATATEIDRVKRFLAAYNSPGLKGIDGWAAFCQALLASAEFRYLD